MLRIIANIDPVIEMLLLAVISTVLSVTMLANAAAVIEGTEALSIIFSNIVLVYLLWYEVAKKKIRRSLGDNVVTENN